MALEFRIVKADPQVVFEFRRRLFQGVVQKLLARVYVWLSLAALPLLTSCASTAMHAHFRDYNAAYADALNEQMLLNLARLENGHPAYYLAIGAIDDRLTVSGSATVGNTGSFTDQKTTAPAGITRLLSSVFGYNASGTVNRSSNPEFQFIPLNNEAVSAQVLQPISTDVFYTLYQQGYPIDQLMRVMIERIETTLPGSSKQELILVNSPTRGTPESYGRFLRTCAILRELQLRGYLSLEATNELEDLGPVSFGQGSGPKGGGATPGTANSKTPTGGPKKGRANPDGDFTKPGNSDTESSPEEAGAPPSNEPGQEQANPGNYPTIKDYSDLETKKWILTNGTNGEWRVASHRETPLFTLKKGRMMDVPSPANPRMAAILQSLTNSTLTAGQLALVPVIVQSLTNTDFVSSKNQAVIMNDVEAVFTVVELLNEGISVQTKVSGETRAPTRLVLRSFGRAMEAVAGEQPPFDALAATNEQFRSLVPDTEKNPVLRIDWAKQKEPLVPPLQTIHYAGRSYEITDPVLNPLNPNASWNRDIFRLMVALGSQVTVDISKFQQQVFELRSN